MQKYQAISGFISRQREGKDAQATVMDGRRRIIGSVLLVMAIFLFMTWLRCFYGSMEAYSTGEDLLKQKQMIRAITYFDRSIHWYTPWNPYVEKSAERLWEIGEWAEQEGDLTMALIAFRTIRGGFYAASHFITPGKEWIEKSESKIDRLVGTEKKTEPESRESKLKEMIRQSQKGSSPDVFWTVVLEIGFFGWIGSLFGFIFRKWGSKEGSKHLFKPLTWLGFGSAFFAMWIIGMIRA
jgi:hypothetical protein